MLIGDIRAAIGDSARESRVIKTHHGIGYSFIGEVVEIARAPSLSSTGPTFVVTVGKRRILLPEGTVTVGRDDGCDIVLPHRSVSRLHARLTVSGETLVVEDAASKNGTCIDGVRLTAPSPAGDGQRVVFGSAETLISVERPSAGSTITAPDAD